MSLKQKTINGIIWSAIDSLAGQGVLFIVGIILARLLSPREFGLIGMITVLIAVSESFINSGFSSALIRKKDCTQTDYSTVFYFNLAMGTVLFLVLFFSAPAVSVFFKEPELKDIVQVLASVLIIDSLTITQRTTLTKRIDFKLQARISIIAAVGSGSVAIIMAYAGFGVWSLVALQLVRRILNSIFLWLWNRWRPSWIFSKKSFKELFGFGSKLLLSGMIDTIYRNVYYLVIGKYFSAQQLGFYTRASQFNDLPSHNLTTIMSRVTYPVLAQLQDNPEKLKAGYRKLIKTIMLISLVLMMGMAAVAEPLIITLIGEKWRQSVIYLQMLTFVGMMYPLHALNLNMLNVQGRSDLFLTLEIIKKILAVPTIVIGVLFGIKAMIAGMMVNTVIAYYLNSYWSGRFIKYPMRQQLLDILPSFLVAATMAVVVYLTGKFIPAAYFVKLLIQLSIGGALTVALCEWFRVDSYLSLKEIVKTGLIKIKNGRK